MRRAAWLVVLALAAASCSPGPAPPRSAPATASPSRAPSSPAPTLSTSQPFRFAAVGDVGDGGPGARRVAAAIARLHAERPLALLLLLGDLIYPRGDPAEYRSKFEIPYGPVIATGIERKAVLGNHDLETDPDRVARLFCMPGRFYDFVRGPVHFFALDTSTGSVSTAQRRWLEDALRRSTSRWRVAFTHVPLYSSGQHGSNPSLQRALVPLFERYGVRLVLAGHDHDYERTLPLRGTTYVVSGGGCCPRPGGTGPFTARAASLLHFLVVEVASDRMTLEAVDADGRAFDRTEIS
jgi:3',5'-cyclic AMP phosphodiesterase CpdA